jgi:hypothetical protein
MVDMTFKMPKRHTHQIDVLYTIVLNSALNEDSLEADEIEDIRLVLWTVLLAQEPIGVETITRLADIDDEKRVIHALPSLRSVLHQSEGTGLVSTLHASFPEFMLSSERSRNYFCDSFAHNQSLAWRCFIIMKEQLRFNICGLDSSLVPDARIENLQQRIESRIPATLAYACRHWANHLASASMADRLYNQLHEFLCDRLLYWMEVLNLRRELFLGVDGLLKAQKWLIVSFYFLSISFVHSTF